ncbi:poly(A) RNA polymerase GLD2 isoform X2 [Callorhinchus milii]|uniref:polynucleotide adenylyltransferase n=2 Tax=Callorhinchus milii TaxID=7868 RepID=A0A4W3K359_CALMI|nr:poly(A) RNA polymerase GLD2 isoform X2 [Callorhinchus milii]|eukprot:gi/632949642/ref/XP_007890278.1/ PREDICTED: poly(A) RNA polymerase GLD2 isoform X3 [Callorhinchus milii]
MFPNSPNLGRQPYSPVFFPHQQFINSHNFRNVTFPGTILTGEVSPGPSQVWPFYNAYPVFTQNLPNSHGRKRRSDERSGPYDVKRQRFQSPQSQPPSSAVPFRADRRHSVPSPGISSLLPLIDYPQNDLQVARDKLSQQILELFHDCQQQSIDLDKKDLCRAELQREIQRIFPQTKLYLVGSSLNGFGTRSSDADLCLVLIDKQINQKSEALHILTLIQQLFYRLSYIERPQLIRAKVPIVKFRDKVSGVECDLNVNNVVGIRNTFLLRTYAYTLPEPVIPSLQKEHPECFDPTMQLHLVHQGGSKISPYLSLNSSNLGDLLVGFLQYYATEFNWNNSVISVREAKVMSKNNEMEWKNKYICVEEPYDRTNTARAVHENIKFDMIRKEFIQSWHKLKNNKDLFSILPARAAVEGRGR